MFLDELWLWFGMVLPILGQAFRINFLSILEIYSHYIIPNLEFPWFHFCVIILYCQLLILTKSDWCGFLGFFCFIYQLVIQLVEVSACSGSVFLIFMLDIYFGIIDERKMGWSFGGLDCCPISPQDTRQLFKPFPFCFLKFLLHCIKDCLFFASIPLRVPWWWVTKAYSPIFAKTLKFIAYELAFVVWYEDPW